MRCVLIIPVFIFFSFVFDANCQTKWQSATILLEGKSIKDLNSIGIAFDHGHFHAGVSYHGDFTEQEIEQIRKAGFEVKISSYHEPEIESRNSPANCNNEPEIAPEFPLPTNYQYGSMNGFLSLSEIYESLEIMHDLFPNLITIKKAIGNYRTTDQNQIYYVKISDNPNQDENEPEVLYTALHHAREPVSMSQMMFFMWHILENYGRDEAITSLINNRELFFIPCVNPDGYRFNEDTNPNGGGFWRKNRSPNADGIGTDLNRNYEQGWAYDNDGSSPSGTSDTYRGTEPFSETETSALQYFCENRQFTIAMNYHAFGDLLIIPWGYLDRPTVDSSLFNSIAKIMTRYNHFEVGTSNQTLSYKVNGVADDWFYGEQIFKNKTYAFTPEVGYAFWPQRKDILSLNQSTQYMNLVAAWTAGECAHFTEESPKSITADTNFLTYNVTRLGVVQGSIKIHLESNQNYIQFINNDLELQLNPGETKQISIPFVVDGNPSRGDSIEFTALLTTGVYSETLKNKKAFVGRAGWADNFLDDRKWFSPAVYAWMLTAESFVSAPNSLTDSPLAPMEANTEKVFQNSLPIDLTNAKYAYLKFKAKWDLDDLVDYAQVRVSENGIHFQSLCGKYTKSGSQFQEFGEPVYCGEQKEWVSEWIDLKDYIGKILLLQVFLYTGSNEAKKDGYYFDDMEVFTDLTTQTFNANDFSMGELFPLPAHDKFSLKLNTSTNLAELNFEFISASGKEHKIESKIQKGLIEFETSALVPGLYFLSVKHKDQKPSLYKVLIQ
ncbi:MAG: immune inhibitor A [Saprospiraceae bacterium]|nr:immune inhibitor A [Saprospiraceae bacterium]